ncbi:MAG: type sorting protein, partial [Segetibacter sp.]|nr:type sorting protein [Segetibacter sp.]
MRKNILLLLAILFTITVIGQKADRVLQEQCGTMQRLELKFERHPDLKARFEEQRSEFNKAVREGTYKSSSNLKSSDDSNSKTANTIPVVFHIVLANPNSVTDAQIRAQLDTLNKDFFGLNGDSVKIPAYFKSFYGKSSLQFCLAQRTPGGE